MATIKSYTDIEQSRRLAEILPLESADMYYECTKKEPEYKVYVGRNIAITYNLFSYRNGHTIPCWSLASLLGVLPDYTLQTNTDRTVFVVCESKKPMISDAYNNPVDACVAMIEKLHELKML